MITWCTPSRRSQCVPAATNDTETRECRQVLKLGDAPLLLAYCPLFQGPVTLIPHCLGLFSRNLRRRSSHYCLFLDSFSYECKMTLQPAASARRCCEAEPFQLTIDVIIRTIPLFYINSQAPGSATTATCSTSQILTIINS